MPSLSLMLAVSLTLFMPGKKAKLLNTRPNGRDLAYITEFIQSGKVKPVIDRRYHASEASAAHGYSEQGRSLGKVILIF